MNHREKKQEETNQCNFTVKGNYVLTVRILLLAQRIGDQVFLVPYNSPDFLTQTLFEGTDAQSLIYHKNGSSWVKSPECIHSPHHLTFSLRTSLILATHLSSLHFHHHPSPGLWCISHLKFNHSVVSDSLRVLPDKNCLYTCYFNRIKGTDPLVKSGPFQL